MVLASRRRIIRVRGRPRSNSCEFVKFASRPSQSTTEPSLRSYVSRLWLDRIEKDKAQVAPLPAWIRFHPPRLT